MSVPLPDGVRLGTLGELPAVVVDTPACSAQLTLQGAHLVSWQPAGHQPVLFTSERAAFRPGTAIRGGIPLCGPWFGAGRRGDSSPAHGFYRISPWRLAAADREDDGTVVLQLELTAADLVDVDAVAKLAPGTTFWPDEASLRYEVRLGTELAVTLSTSAAADGLDLEEALHSYFVVGDVRQARVTGLDGVRYLDQAAERSPSGALAQATQVGDVTFTAETDRIYQDGRPTAVIDPVLGRRIDIEPTRASQRGGSGSTIVWNPWEAKAARLADLGDDAWIGMVCVETANVGDAGVVIPPDSTRSIGARIRVTRL